MPERVRDARLENERAWLETLTQALPHRRRAAVRAAVAHAASFGTWRSLCVAEGLSDRAAVDLMVGMVEAAAGVRDRCAGSRRLMPGITAAWFRGRAGRTYGRHMSGNLNEFGITHLRHVDLAVPDFETQRTFYKDTWGLTEQGKDGNLSYFAAEGSPEQYVVRLRRPTRSGST